MNDYEYDYEKERLREQIKYYKKTSKLCQRKYKIISIINIITSAIIPAISLMTNLHSSIKYIVAIIGSISTVCTSIIYFCKYKERWVQSRTTLNLIESELVKFHTKTCHYKNLDRKESYNSLVENCEQFLNQEHSDWENTMIEKNKS